MYVKELTVKYRRRRISAALNMEGAIGSPHQAARLLETLIGSEIVEVCGLLCLSVRHQIVAYHELSRGTLNASIVHPRDVFRTALLANAAMVIVGHNHPSGDPTPSVEDVQLTSRLRDSADVVGIEMADHVIVTACGRYYSFKEAGRV